MPKITYHSNNSGGGWWLTDEDWYALAGAGWEVDWFKDKKDPLFRQADGRFLGALATRASKDFTDRQAAIDEWESITHQSASSEGCSCCGAPHDFD